MRSYCCHYHCHQSTVVFRAWPLALACLCVATERGGGRAGGCARARACVRAGARMGWRVRASLKKQSANNQRTKNKQQTTNSKQQKNKEQSLGTVSGRFWVPKAEYSPEENQRSERYLREHLGIRSPAQFAYPRVALPLCPRTAEYLFRSKPPYGSANFGGSPRTESISSG